jgi:Protein of unknown function (DUF2911)
MRRVLFVRCFVLSFLLAPAALAAQEREPRVKPSQHGTVSQTVDQTTITIAYDRPVARGRELFGGIVPWGHAWTPGANWATTIEFDRDVTVEGHAVPAGSYSIWTIPGADEWTFILSKRDRVFHTRYPKGQDLVRFTVRPIAGEHMETLAWYFPVVAADHAVLHLHWGTTVVAVAIGVEPGG